MTATIGSWWEDGEAFSRSAVERPTDLDAPSALPDWDRRTAVAHVAHNADALLNLLTWAHTGVETPMYFSVEARDAAIASSASLPYAELVADSTAAAQRLHASVEALTKGAWSVQVQTAQGRTVPASKVLWMRCREVWVHTVDLGSASLDGVPDDVLAALLDDALAVWAAGENSQTPPSAGLGAPGVRGPSPWLGLWRPSRTMPWNVPQVRSRCAEGSRRRRFPDGYSSDAIVLDLYRHIEAERRRGIRSCSTDGETAL